MVNPCFGCKERHVRYDEDGKAHSCHADCARHAEFSRRNAQLKDKKHKANFMNGCVYDSTERVRKKSGFYKKNK